MKKLASSGLVVALLGLPVGFLTAGCSDNAGGNEEASINQTKGTVGPDAPDSPEQYYQKAKAKAEAK